MDVVRTYAAFGNLARCPMCGGSLDVPVPGLAERSCQPHGRFILKRGQNREYMIVFVPNPIGLSLEQ